MMTGAKTHIKITLLILFLITAVGKTTSDVDVDALRDTLESYSKEISLAYYYNDVYGTLLDTDEIYEKYEHIFTDIDLITTIHNKYLQEEDPLTRRSYLYLYKDLSEEFLYIKLRKLYEEFYNKEATLTITVDGEEIAYRDIGLLIYLSEDSDYRKKLYEADNELIKSDLNPLLKEILDVESEEIIKLNYDDYKTFWQMTRETDFQHLWTIMSEVLRETEEIARTFLEQRTGEKLGLDISEVEPWDRGQIWRESKFDEYFTADSMIPNIKKLYSGLGIEIDLQPNILLDLEDRPEKGPRAGTYTILVPDDIRISCKPSAGLDDYATLLHEMGHAEHYANTTVENYEFKMMGDIGTSETYAFLFEDLLMDDNYLTEELEIPEDTAKSIIERQLFSYIYSLRYYIAKLFYEPALHSARREEPRFYNLYLQSLPPSVSKTYQEEIDAVELYRYLTEKTLFFPRKTENAEAGYLLADESFYTIYYIKAWMLSTQLRKYLIDNYGERWYKSETAGEFLRNLWSYGETYPPEDISEILGFESLNADCLLDFIDEKYNLIED